MSNDNNHRTRWTADEVSFLVESWDGTTETAEAVAELLGRTTDAVRQHYYQIQWNTAAKPVDAKPEPGEPTHQATAAYRRAALNELRHNDVVCSSCFTVRAKDGSCLC